VPSVLGPSAGPDLLHPLLMAGVLGPAVEALVAGEGLDDLARAMATTARRVFVVGAGGCGGDGVVPITCVEGELPFRAAELDLVVTDDPAVAARAAAVVRDRGTLLLCGGGAPLEDAAWDEVASDDERWRLLRRRARRPSLPPMVVDVAAGPCIEPADPVLLLARHLTEPIVLVDGGCRGGFHGRWLQLGPHVHLIGFDPDVDECARLRAAMAWHPRVTFVERALGSEPGTATFFVPNEPAGSSLLPPDLEGTSHLGSMDGAQPGHVTEAEVVRLDDWVRASSVGQVDAMKLDVEGAELLALEGAPEVLAGVTALEIEVRFNRNNVGAPHFGDVDALLRSSGFALWVISEPAHYRLGDTWDLDLDERVDRHHYLRRDGVVEARDVSAPPGQLVWANAHWVRTAAFRPVALPWQQRLRMAIVARALELHDVTAVNLRAALRASPPAAAADAIVAAMGEAAR
jgi:FkbM family methyltransferase